MNILLFCLFLSALYSDEPKDLLAVDIRQRIMNDKQIRIVIQINNNWQRLYSDNKKCFMLKDYFEPTENQIGIFGFDFNKNKPLSISLKNKKHFLIFLSLN